MNKSEILSVAKPILFNTPMVQAILNNRKSETRRIIKYPPCGYFEFEPPKVKEPYQVGDILYVRETWCWCPCWHCGKDSIIEDCGNTICKFYNIKHREWGCYEYKADWIYKTPPFNRWYPSIHMPKEAARIFLRITDVRVERLQDITEKQASEEGCIDNRGFIHSYDNEYDKLHTAREHFTEIWDSTIKKTDLDRYGWNANPWVWVIEFERVEVE